MAENRNGQGRVYHRSAKPRKSASRTFGESADWSDHEGCEALYTNRLVDLLKCLRPGQWAKNLLLLAAPFFAFFDHTARPWDWVHLQETLGMAVVAFVLLSGAAYVLNDLADAKADARNPLRKTRPIAARKVSVPAAILLVGLCLGGAAAATWQVSRLTNQCAFLWIAVAYALLQPFYTFVARRMGEVAAVVVAVGFVLRAAAGAAAAEVSLSFWLLLCVFLGALLVALCKRRSVHFLKGMPQPSAADGRILDLEIGLVASATVSCYALYTCAAETVAKFGTRALLFTLPLVILGVFRFLRLTYGDHATGTPETAILRDPGMVSILVLWVTACGVLLRFAAGV